MIRPGTHTCILIVCRKKYSTYRQQVDPEDDDRATGLVVYSIRRPHMRAFHLAWIGVLVSYFVWFAIAPLLLHIRNTIGLTKFIIWKSTVYGVSSTIFVRFVVGPLCDLVGARIVFASLLIISSIGVAGTGLIEGEYGLYIVRTIVGFAGAVLAVGIYWGFRMFTKQWAGTVAALIGGAGPLGGAITQKVISEELYPAFLRHYDSDSEKAWRIIGLVPASVGVVMALVIYFLADDTPKGSRLEFRSHGVMRQPQLLSSFLRGVVNVNTWVLFLQHASCMGAELTMLNASVLFFKDRFGMSTEEAVDTFRFVPWLHILLRFTGGFLSDILNHLIGIRGRVFLQTVLLLAIGLSVFFYEELETIHTTKIVAYVAMLCAQAAQGTTFSIVPHASNLGLGYVVGVVAAGGNSGALSFGLAFRYLDFTEARRIMAWIILGSTLGSILLFFFLDGGQAARRQTIGDEEEDIFRFDSDEEDELEDQFPIQDIEVSDSSISGFDNGSVEHEF